MSTSGNSKVRMNISQSGIDFVREQEGCVYHLYDDVAGNCTIGVGHLVHMGRTGTNPTAEELYVGGISDSQVDELLNHDLSDAESAVNDYVSVPLSQNQFDALVDFCFNEGSARLLHSTLLAQLNAGAYDSVPDQLGRWVYAGGKVSKGLKKRRDAEAALWQSA